jgi:hypothetical protein
MLTKITALVKVKNKMKKFKKGGEKQKRQEIQVLR